MQEWRDALAAKCKKDQQHCLWQLMSRIVRKGRRDYYMFHGHSVCIVALKRATGCFHQVDTYKRAIKHGVVSIPPDLRQSTLRRPRACPQSQNVDDHLQWLYDKTAEFLPDVPDISTASSSRASAPKSEMKHLPPGCWTEVWAVHAALCKMEKRPHASLSTFRRRVRSDRWRLKLCFRPKHQHAKCDTCARYKILIKTASSFEIQNLWGYRYGKHLASQMRCREVYYSRRAKSIATSHGRLVGSAGCATLIIDAIDQAKFACPRHTPNSKLLEDTYRPRLHVIGVRIAGYLKAGFILDPTISKDADCWVEVVVRSLALLQTVCKKRVIEMPRTLYIMSDNANDNKNNHTFSCIALMLAFQRWDECTFMFLRTGHSHEDIDAMFGHWAWFLLRQSILETPIDFKNVMASRFTDTHFEVVSHVREFSEWFGEALVKISGMSRSVGSAHSFQFMRRSAYNAVEYGEPVNEFADEPCVDDVLIVCRKYISSPDLCQAPFVALPFRRAQAFRESGITSPPVALRLSYSEDQKKELRKTAARLSEHPFNLHNAARYLRSLADGSKEFWSSDPPKVDFSLTLDNADNMDLSVPLFACRFEPASNTVEPTMHARIVRATPAPKKFVRKRKLGRGRMSASAAPDCPVAESDNEDVDANGDFIE